MLGINAFSMDFNLVLLMLELWEYSFNVNVNTARRLAFNISLAPQPKSQLNIIFNSSLYNNSKADTIITTI